MKSWSKDETKVKKNLEANGKKIKVSVQETLFDNYFDESTLGPPNEPDKDNVLNFQFTFFLEFSTDFA